MPWPLPARIGINILINLILVFYILIDALTIGCNFITTCAEKIEIWHHQTSSQTRRQRHLQEQIRFLKNRNLNLRNETMDLRRQRRQFLNMINERDNLQLSNHECPHHAHRPQAQSMFFTSEPQASAKMGRSPVRLLSPPPTPPPTTSQQQIQDSDDSSKEDSYQESNPHTDRPPKDNRPSPIKQITTPSRMESNVPRDLKAPPLRGQPVSTTGPFATDSCPFHGRFCPHKTPLHLRRARKDLREHRHSTQNPSVDSTSGLPIIQKVAEVIMVRDLDLNQEHSPMDPDMFNGIRHRRDTPRERSCPPTYSQATMAPQKPCPPSPPQRTQSLPSLPKELTEPMEEELFITQQRPPTPFPHGDVPTTPLLQRLEPQAANLEPLHLNITQDPSSENFSRMTDQHQKDKENRPPQNLPPGPIRLTIQPTQGQDQGQEFEVQLMEFPDEPHTEDSTTQTSHNPN